MDVYAIALILNYLVFGALFLWRYLNPERWSEWVVESSLTYKTIYLATTFIVACLFATSINSCISIVFVISLIGLLFLLKGVMGGGIQGLIPFFLYLSTIIQEVYYAFTDSDEKAIIYLMGWYFTGAFMLLAFSKPIGALIDKMNPGLSKRHLDMIKKIFGPNAPRAITLKDGSMHINMISSPGGCAAISVIYVVWMLLKYVVFSMIF